MPNIRFRTQRNPVGRRAGTTFVVGTAALSVLLTGCGGTRVSDEAIEKAAGVGPVQKVPGAVADGLGAAPTVQDTNPAAAPSGAGTVATGPATAPPTNPGTQNTGGTKATPGPASTGNQQGATGGQAPGPVTKKSLIKLGAVGTFSGPVGALVKDTVTGIRAWSAAVNAAGGVNGHPIEVLVGDDGGDPARFNSILQQFVEQQGVLAMLYTTLGFSPNGNNKYLDSKKIYTISSEGGLEVPYNNPYVLSPTPAGLTYADAMILGFSNGIGAKNGMKLASFACSDFGLCDNFDKRWSDKTVLEKAGFSLVARGRPSLTQPDYTSQCLAAKQAGAEAIILALDGAAIRRFASDCARQNYRPKLSSADLVITKDLLTDKNVDGLVVGSKLAAFPDSRVPGIKEALAAFAQYVPGSIPTGGMTFGWVIGEFFAQIGKNLPDNPTRKDLEDGIYAVKNNNLKGLTFPITMTRGKPMARQLCYGTVLIQAGKFVPAPGPGLNCANGGKPMSTPDDYTAISTSVAQGSTRQGAADQGAPTRTALTASTPTDAPPSRAWLPEQPPIAGVLPAPPRVATTAAPTRATPRAPAPAAEECPPARVAGASYLLDAFQTGSAAGPGVFYGIALAALGTPLPEPLGQYQGQFLAESAKAVEQFSKDAPAAVQELRTYLEPLAAYNEHANEFIDAGAKALEVIATDYGSFIQPGDTSLRQLADSFRDAKATDAPCGAADAPNSPTRDQGHALEAFDENVLSRGGALPTMPREVRSAPAGRPSAQ